MSPLIDDLIRSHGAEVTNLVSNRFNIPVEKAAGLLPAVAPLILGGLQRQAQEKGGAERVDHILDKHADDSILDNIGEFFMKKTAEPAEKADPGLGGLLGDAGHQATGLIGDKLGISKETAMQIIPVIAPIILGFLLKQRNQAGGGAAGQNVLMGILDRDGDGSILDDVGGLLGGAGGLGALLGGGGASKSGAAGMIGDLLGGLLGGKKK